MLLDRGLVFYRAQGAQVEALDGRPLQFGLEFGLDDRKVDVVVVQFVQNVEARVVSRVEFVGVERARRIERIGIGVDVEFAFHFARHVVGCRRQRSRRLLLPVGAVGNQVQRQVFEDVVGGVDVGRVAFHLAGLRPARVAHGAQRRIVGRFVGSGREAHRVGVHDVVVEQLAEPVRVAELRRAQVIPDACVVVLQLSGRNHLVHLSEYAAFRIGDGFCEVEPVFFLHVHVHRHLVLRVHNVEIPVGRNHAVGEFAGVVDGAHAGAAAFGGDDDDARHGARSVDGGGGAVFQNVEAFDVFGIESGDGRCDERRGVARGEVVGVDVDDVLHDDAVHHPQRLRTAVN